MGWQLPPTRSTTLSTADVLTVSSSSRGDQLHQVAQSAELPEARAGRPTRRAAERPGCGIPRDGKGVKPILPLVFLTHVPFIGVNDFMSSSRVFDGCFFLVSRVVLMVSFHVVGMWFIRSSYSSLEKGNFFSRLRTSRYMLRKLVRYLGIFCHLLQGG